MVYRLLSRCHITQKEERPSLLYFVTRFRKFFHNENTKEIRFYIHGSTTMSLIKNEYIENN